MKTARAHEWRPHPNSSTTPTLSSPTCHHLTTWLPHAPCPFPRYVLWQTITLEASWCPPSPVYPFSSLAPSITPPQFLLPTLVSEASMLKCFTDRTTSFWKSGGWRGTHRRNACCGIGNIKCVCFPQLQQTRTSKLVLDYLDILAKANEISDMYAYY